MNKLELEEKMNKTMKLRYLNVFFHLIFWFVILITKDYFVGVIGLLTIISVRLIFIQQELEEK